MRSLSYHPRVPSEVRGILGYYETISPILADEFWIELTNALEYARQHPTHHHFAPGGRRRSNLRRFPYHFLFRVFPTTVRITAVRHNRRDPNLGASRA